MHSARKRWRNTTQFRSAKALTNEGKYPNIVELTVTVDGLDVSLGRRITEFHNSRHIQPRHGRRIVRQGRIYYRWCFSDPASAHAFIEEFGGALCKPELGGKVAQQR
jgi:hypothetical protein